MKKTKRKYVTPCKSNTVWSLLSPGILDINQFLNSLRFQEEKPLGGWRKGEKRRY